MLKTIAIACLTVSSVSVMAQSTCTPREYAQYKDEVKTRLGRHSTATLACRYEIRRETFSNGGNGRAADQCAAEVTKARDALSSVKDQKALTFIDGGCNSDYLADTR